ncbi:MAG: dicarboxylate/amino acid:cation symporter [Proteobacteria bacterium]|nr:dicarboxylate/amino acid:cation symporter [Pseudomonadota bacterium]
MKKSCCSHNTLFVLIAFILGIVSGLLNIEALNNITNIISDVFMRLLKLLSLPVICFSLLSTLSGLGNWKRLQDLGFKVVRYTILTTIIAASLAAFLFFIFNPSMPNMAIVKDTTQASQGMSYINHLLNIVPSNILQPFVDHNVIGVLFIALFFGLGILKLPDEKREPLHHVLDAIFSAVMILIKWVVSLMPLAVFAFVTQFVLDFQKSDGFKDLFIYIFIVVLANLIQAIVVLPLLLKQKNIPVLKTFKGMSKALYIAFFSKSSAAAMPIAMDCAEKLNVTKNVVRFSFPLCTTINMNACAAFIYITVMFVSSSHGVVIDTTEKFMYIFVATIAAIGNAGVPMGCFFLASALLTTMGVPITLMGVILPVYALIDMLESAINIWSDACVTLMVDKDLNVRKNNTNCTTNCV